MGVCYLLLVIVTSGVVCSCTGGFEKAIYVDSKNGTPDSVCWTGGEKQPCGSLELALKGAQLLNSTVVILPGKLADSYLDKNFISYDRDNTADNSTHCPPWYRHNGTACECGSDLDGIIHCDPRVEYILVLNGYCMTYDNNTGMTIVGVCLHNFFNVSNAIASPYLSNYHKVPADASQLNEAMCGDFNRQGQLCGECKDGYTFPVYSYELACMNCTYSRYNWVKYFFVAYVPLTLFLFAIIFLRISTTSPPMVAFVLVSQFCSAPLVVRFLLVASKSNASLNTLARVVTSVYGIWNLDFFRTLIPPTCLQITTLQATALDYAIAFYPLVLILMTYSVIELHIRNYRLVRWLWRPFHRCCIHFRRRWNVRTSIIDVFATFLFLSVIKFLSVSFDILVPSQLFDVNGTRLNTHYLYHDTTIEYFGKEHLPYAILASLIFTTVFLLPLLLLLLYPCKCCQRCLTRLHLRSHVLHTFMDAFEGSLKDGTNGTRDCRYFAAMYLGESLVIYIVYSTNLNGYYLFLSIVANGAICICHIVVQPYKLFFYNIVASTLFLILSLCSILILAVFNASTYLPNHFYLTITLLAIVCLLPQLYITAVLMHWLVCKSRIPQMILRRLHIRIPNVRNLEETLPDRLTNPEEYERLLSDSLEGLDENKEHSLMTAY